MLPFHVLNMDEEELLLETSYAFDVSNLSELDESAILGDDDFQEDRSIKDETVDRHEETEELDYDEDLEAEKAPRSSKFTSERALMQKRSLQTDAKKEDHNQREIPINASGRRSVEAAVRDGVSSLTANMQLPDSTTPTVVRAPKVFINPHHKGVIRPQANLSFPWEAVVSVPNAHGLQQAVSIAPQNSVAILSQLQHSLAYPIVASSSTDFSHPPPQIMPLPNFSTPPPSIYPNQFVAESVGQIPSAGQWDQMVEGFLRRTTVRSRSRFSRSSRSTYSTSRSRSRSYSSHSSSSTASSRSSSRSPYRRIHSRCRRSSSRRPLSYRSRNEANRRRPHDRLKHISGNRREIVHHFDRSRNRNDVAKQEKTMECAKAIGLDSEYLTKLEEQKKMREEILRKKEERRIQAVQRLGGPALISTGESSRHLDRSSNFSERRVEHCRKIDEKRSRRRDHDSKDRRASEIRSTEKELIINTSSRRAVESGPPESEVFVEQSVVSSGIVGSAKAVENSSLQKQAISVTTAGNRAGRENQPHPEKVRKKKAYLAVVVSSLNQAPINLERIRLIAETVGPTKKAWKSAESTVSLIFEQHESAKKFMFHYHNRVIHGVHLAVTLQKLFANLADFP